MDDFINQLTAIGTTWHSAGALAALILVVNLLVNLTKLQLFQNKVPAQARGYIAMGLGVLGSLITALSQGKPLIPALFAGLTVGMGAIGLHEGVTNLKASTKAKYAMLAKKVAVGALVLMIAGISACHFWKNDVVKPVDAAIDCVETEAKASVNGQSATTVAKNLFDQLANAALQGYLSGGMAGIGPAILAEVGTLLKSFSQPLVACVVNDLKSSALISTFMSSSAGSGSGSGTKLVAPVNPVDGVITTYKWTYKQ